MEEPSINIYLEAKNEYTKRLTASLVPLLFEGFNSLYEDACKFKDETRDPRYDDYSELQIFQDYLKKIPKWNNDLIEQEYDRIVQRSKCKYLDELLWAVIFSNIKVLSVIRSRNPKNDVEHEYIALKDFIHKCYKECARELYSSDVVILFDKESVSVLERSKNIRDIKKIIEKGILESISESLPYKQIIRTYIGKIPAEYEEDTENSMSNPHFEANSFMKFLGKNRESFMAARTPTATITEIETETETNTVTEIEKEQEQEQEQENTCAICMEVTSKTKNVSFTECGHVYCTSCLLKALQTKNTCPMCRAEIEPARKPNLEQLTANVAADLIQAEERDIDIQRRIALIGAFNDARGRGDMILSLCREFAFGVSHSIAGWQGTDDQTYHASWVDYEYNNYDDNDDDETEDEPEDEDEDEDEHEDEHEDEDEDEDDDGSTNDGREGREGDDVRNGNDNRNDNDNDHTEKRDEDEANPPPSWDEVFPADQVFPATTQSTTQTSSIHALMHNVISGVVSYTMFYTFYYTLPNLVSSLIDTVVQNVQNIRQE